MAKKGLLDHLGYGRYRVKSFDEYVKVKNDVRSAYELLKKSELPYALTGVDAVFAWTRGGYNVGRFFGFYPVHLRVHEGDVAKWTRWFRSFGWKSFSADFTPKETLFGVFYLLHPAKRIETEDVEGLKVEPLARTIEFCMKNLYTFEPALEMLDEEYRLGLGIKYSQ